MVTQKKKIVHEIKFVIKNYKIHQVIHWLKCYCKTDPEFPSGSVSSIYYDTKEWRFMGEKINSDYFKTKVRVRWYSDIKNINHYDTSFVEAKYKIGSRREKTRIKTPYSGDWLSMVPLNNPELCTIPYILFSNGEFLTQKIYPVFQISYKRQRFIDPFTRSRICIDYDICAPRVNNYMVSKFNSFNLTTAVFEMKSELSKLPLSLQPLIDIGLKKSSFSKYSTCYQKINNILF